MSLLNRLFYVSKPLIPRGVQIFLRRKIAAYKRRKYSHVWPVDPNSAAPPAGWKGWPEGKQFALVLCHDVDTGKGYRDVLKLAEIEESMGFRSCFSFVPERYGRVSVDLLDELRSRGFDVAVHGLKHDGKLFFSRRSFLRQAPKVNAYLKEWKTAGFTSPSMHHNLDWMGALDIKYSISTFDTDPFEPQPDGVGTIFPFIVYRNGVQPAPWNSGESGTIPPGGSPFKVQDFNSPGPTNPTNSTNSIDPVLSSPPSLLASQPPSFFIELPYTLPQDSALFLILEEKTIDIWKTKLDWIAGQGGMALLNTHPDYMDFNGGDRSGSSYPVQHYIDFLEYIQSRYAGRYFHALPADVAALFVLPPSFLASGFPAFSL